MKILISSLIVAILSISVVIAGSKNPGEAEAWMKQAIAKETKRAQDAQQHHANTERFEKKYGWAKEKHAGLYSSMMDANAKAAEAWSQVAQQAESVDNPESLSSAKLAANEAASEAYLAEIALKYSAAAAERSHMAEKTGSANVSNLAAQLDANEEALLAANRAKSNAGLVAEKLHIENRALNKALRDAYHQARSAAKEEHVAKEKEGQHHSKKK